MGAASSLTNSSYFIYYLWYSLGEAANIIIKSMGINNPPKETSLFIYVL